MFIVDYEFAFRSGSLNRAAHLRSTDIARTDPSGRVLVFWHGKILADDAQRPVFVTLDHPALADCREAPIFLGLTSEGPRFAADLALWQPQEDAATIGEFTDASQQYHPAFPASRFVEVRGIMAGLSLVEGECVAVGRALQSWHNTHRFCSNCGAPTLPELSGWQRDCPACATKHFPRTDPVVIMAITRGDELLLGRGPSWPERMYSLLAGFVEPGETIEAAVRRETMEESGITVGRVDYVTSQPWPFPMSLMFGCWGEASDDTITIDSNELADARWVSRDEVHRILRGEHPDIATPRHGAIAGALIAAWADDKIQVPSTWER